MVDIKDLSKCCGCGACEQICPKQCIAMVSNDEGFLYPKVDVDTCIACGKCERVCPFATLEKQDCMNEAYAAVNGDEEVRFHSSSGGVFSVVAELIESSGGVVYGAYFSQDFKTVLHGKNSVEKLRTSKYLQSVMGNAYIEAEKDLKQGKQVLFTGTPCQIAGLKNFLKIDYDNLLCVDVICHGVPSPGIWEKYLTAEEKKNNARTNQVNFRYKKSARQLFNTNIKNDIFEVYESPTVNPYMNLFLENYSLRPSCYQCVMKECGSSADITLGDFWGVEKIMPEINDGRGISLVIVHTSRGVEWFAKIQNRLTIKKVDYAAAARFNKSIFKSATPPEDREAFFADFGTMGITALAEKYCIRKKTMREKFVKSAVGRIIKKIIYGEQAPANEYGFYFLFER